jgi:hypothetical protein
MWTRKHCLSGREKLRAETWTIKGSLDLGMVISSLSMRIGIVFGGEERSIDDTATGGRKGLSVISRGWK